MVEDAGRIVVSGLTKRFDSVIAVDDLSFAAEPGSVTGFLGPNGAGKTTTLRMLVGLVAGGATIGGRRYTTSAAPGREAGVVLEAAGFHPGRSGRNHLRVCCTACGYPLSRADEVLERTGLTEAGGRRVRGYSLGMRQRLALATALLGDPAVLPLPEPANRLGAEGIAWLSNLLQHYARRGRTVLFSSHRRSGVGQLAERVVIISRGKLLRAGPLAELTAGQGGLERVFLSLTATAGDSPRLGGARS